MLGYLPLKRCDVTGHASSWVYSHRLCNVRALTHGVGLINRAVCHSLSGQGSDPSSLHLYNYIREAHIKTVSDLPGSQMPAGRIQSCSCNHVLTVEQEITQSVRYYCVQITICAIQLLSFQPIVITEMVL